MYINNIIAYLEHYGFGLFCSFASKKHNNYANYMLINVPHQQNTSSSFPFKNENSKKQLYASRQQNGIKKQRKTL